MAWQVGVAPGGAGPQLPEAPLNSLPSDLPAPPEDLSLLSVTALRVLAREQGLEASGLEKNEIIAWLKAPKRRRQKTPSPELPPARSPDRDEEAYAVGSLDGYWKDSSGTCRIFGKKVEFPDGTKTELGYGPEGLRMTHPADGNIYTAQLQGPSILKWSDGDQWVRSLEAPKPKPKPAPPRPVDQLLAYYRRAKQMELVGGNGPSTMGGMLDQIKKQLAAQGITNPDKALEKPAVAVYRPPPAPVFATPSQPAPLGGKPAGKKRKRQGNNDDPNSKRSTISKFAGKEADLNGPWYCDAPNSPGLPGAKFTMELACQPGMDPRTISGRVATGQGEFKVLGTYDVASGSIKLQLLYSEQAGQERKGLVELQIINQNPVLRLEGSLRNSDGGTCDQVRCQARTIPGQEPPHAPTWDEEDEEEANGDQANPQKDGAKGSGAQESAANAMWKSTMPAAAAPLE